jgi:integrase
MKVPLTQTLVLTKLNIDVLPEMAADGKVGFKPNPTGAKYYVFDDTKNAPAGFGVLIGKRDKNYFVQRRVDGKLIRVTLGHIREFNSIEQARQKAVEVATTIRTHKQHPKRIKQKEDLNEITLGDAFDRYVRMLQGRATPIKPNTETAIEKAKNRISDWLDRRIRDLGSQEILDRFDAIAGKHRTAAEQTFRWALAAINYVIKLEANDAAAQKRLPTITHNPLLILALNNKFRTKRELEEHYKKNQTRNPLSTETLPQWFAAIMAKRAENRTGCDFLILTTLWGTRYQEITGLCWREDLTAAEAKTSSWVDLDQRLLFLADTKNRSDHTLPIAAGAYELLRQRRELVLAEHGHNFRVSRFVFPAKSKYAKTGHYSDADSLKKYIMQLAGIAKLGVHDLRRTFGRLVEDSGIPYSAVKRMLNHRNLADVTQRYTDVQEERLREYMQKVECIMVQSSPQLWNAIMVPKYPPMLERSDA